MDETRYRVTRVGDDELMHFGIKGMKWGVRRFQDTNGRLTAAGKRRYSDYESPDNMRKDIALRRGSNGSLRLAFDQPALNSRSDVKQLHRDLSADRDKFRSNNSEYANFNSNPQLVKRYQTKAAKLYCKDAGIKDPESVKAIVDGYVHGDLDQGSGNSFEVYCRDKGINYSDLQDRYIRGRHEYSATAKQKVREYLGNQGDRVIAYQTTTVKRNGDWVLEEASVTVADAVVEVLDKKFDSELFRDGYLIPE